MRIIKGATVIVFALMIIIPVAALNTSPDSISKIDNRALAKCPFGENRPKGDLTKNIEKYVQDRIGFRDKMILAFAILNDKLFGKMVHPLYCYGRDGYVFFKTMRNTRFGEFQETFADMISKIQAYCEERGVPFLFAFNPSKQSVLTLYLPKGVNYDNSWVKEFFLTLDKKRINYIDNTGLLIKKIENRECVFNKKFDAGHWNDLGAFYGVNNMLTAIHERIPAVHVNNIDEFSVTEALKTSLLVSEFPIHEYVPAFSINDIADENKTNLFINEVELNTSHRAFSYFVNPRRLEQGSPKTLVFQGSHMNGLGNKYLRNSLGEYIAVHNYHNVINFSYYFNIFKPDCVIFEVAEHTINNRYFNLKQMRTMDFNPLLSNTLAKTKKNVVHRRLDKSDVDIVKGKALTKIVWNKASKCEHVWLLLSDHEFDMRKTEDESKYEATVLSKTVKKFYPASIKIAAEFENQIVLYE